MNESPAFRRAKILCTLGPASRDPEVFRALVEAGLDGVRVNFSHSSHEQAARAIELARDTSREFGRAISVLADLQGPKIRVGTLDSPLEVEAGGTYLVYPENGSPGLMNPAGPVPIPTTYPELATDLGPGDRVLFDDGKIALAVREIQDQGVVLEALEGGTLTSGKGINLPGTEIGAPSLTDKDREDARLALDLGVDYIALSFIRRPDDLDELRQLVDGRALLVAKIEMAQALRNLHGILANADGVMVARGDLGVELDFEEVPLVQKRILRLTSRAAKLGITATQMLESMILSSRPTRAEASDVANALLDGTDALMLSAETAVGDYPVESVSTMSRIIRRIEREPGIDEEGQGGTRVRGLAPVHHTVAGAVAGAAAEATDRLGAPFLVTFTNSGFTAWVQSAQRLQVPILAVTDQPRTWNQLALAYGVVPLLVEGDASYDNMLETSRVFARDNGLGAEGDSFVVTAGVPFHTPGTTNYMRIETL
jgi:pyruvate kinase